jgi:hypothetical protein
MNNVIEADFISFLLAVSLFVVISVSGCNISLDDPPPPHKQKEPHGPHEPGGPHEPKPKKAIAITALTREGNKHGDIRFTMPDGEACQGQYHIVSWSKASAAFTEPEYGKFCSKTNVADGIKCIRIMARGEDGAVIRSEYFPSDLTMAHGNGLVADGEGNIYQIKL